MGSLLVFDIDGVICDSLPSRQAAWDYASRKSSLRLGDLEPELIGLPLDKILERKGVTRYEAVQMFRANFEKQLDSLKGETLFPGAKETLEFLDSIPSVQIGFFSGRPKRRIVSALKSVCLPEHTPFVSANGVSHPPKPSGHGLRHLRKLVGSSCFRRFIFVGDTQLDYLAALEAGFDFIYAEWGYQDLPKDAAYNRVKSWDELARTLVDVGLED